MYRTLNERNYWWIEMKMRKTLSTSIDFPFQSSKLCWESCFALSVNYAALRKEHSSKQVTDNFQRRALLRKIVETLLKSIFSFTIVNLVNKGILYFPYYYRRVTREGRRGLLSCTFLKIGRKYCDFGKRCNDFGHLCVKTLKMFPCSALFFLSS